MNTPSHLIINAAIAKRSNKTKPRINTNAFIWGSVAPDLPLYILTLGSTLTQTLTGTPLNQALNTIFNTLYFTNPWWISAHNFLHAPPMLIILLAASTTITRVTGRAFGWFNWFLAGCALHSLIDILTHHDDGPLLLFPFNWRVRFHSPVSYWDPAYYGNVFWLFELLLDVALLVYLLLPVIKRRFVSRNKDS